MRKNINLLLASVFIVFLTIISLKESVDFSQNLIPISDKILHLSAYIVLTVLWSSYFVSLNIKFSRNKVLIIVAVFLTIYGIIIEVLQSKLTTTRVSEFKDILANLFGILIGIIIIINFKKFKLKSNKGLLF